MIKAGIIGLGKMGLSHFAILSAHPKTEMVAVCDISKLLLGNLERYTPAKSFSSYRKMIDTCELDCVVISTPTSSHAETVRYALERNIHVFVEKPFCLSPEEGRPLVELAAEQGLVNQVGYVNRFNGVFTEARRLIRGGAIGPINHFSAEMYGGVVLKPQGGGWRGKRTEGGGCLYEYGSHCIDLVNYLLGLPRRVTGTVLKRAFSKDTDDAVYTTFLYDDGTTGQLMINWSDPTHRKASNLVSLWGAGGKITVDKQECRVYLCNKEGLGELRSGWNTLYNTSLAQPVDFYLRGEEYSAQLDHFIDCIETGQIENTSSFESAFQTDMVLDLIAQDGAQGRQQHG